MKKTISILLLIITFVSVVITLTMRSELKSQTIHRTMELRADAIIQKADSFMKFNKPESPHLRSKKVFSVCSSYILAIEIPEGLEIEFKTWMKSTRLTVSSADEWPKHRGSITHTGKENIYVTAIYYNNNKERSLTELHLNKTLSKLSKNTIPEIDLSTKRKSS